MLAPIPQFTNRQKVLRALLAPDAQQHLYGLGQWTQDHGPVCIMGMILRCKRQAEQSPNEDLDDASTCAAWVGITETQLWQLAHKNDDNIHFYQLANELETLPLTLEPTPCSEPA